MAELMIALFGFAIGYVAGRADRHDLGPLRLRRRLPRVYSVPSDRLLLEARRRGKLRPVEGRR